jgi:hypothetical protein
MMVLGFIGLGVLLALSGLSRVANSLERGPHWLRQFRDRTTLF